MVVESDDVAQGLVELISKHHVTVLVMGAASDKHYAKYVPKFSMIFFLQQHFYV